jgi:hypothetical protein
MDVKAFAQSPLTGIRGRAWGAVERPVERRTPFSAETLRTLVGSILLALAVRRIVRAVRAGLHT